VLLANRVSAASWGEGWKEVELPKRGMLSDGVASKHAATPSTGRGHKRKRRTREREIKKI